MSQPIRSRRSSRSGHAVIETALLAPWIFFLFVGVLDFGFYSYALIAVQNATRVAALDLASLQAPNDTARACLVVREELRRMPNIADKALDCNSDPLWVNVTQNYTDNQGKLAAQVAVTYHILRMIPIPGILNHDVTLTRISEVRVFGD